MLDIALGLLGLTVYVVVVAGGVSLFKRSDVGHGHHPPWDVQIIVSHKHYPLLTLRPTTRHFSD